MKKIVVIFILFAYSAATMGATVNLHYCMNKFVGWSLSQGEKDNECDRCGMTEKKGGCCKDEQKQIKIDADHQKSSVAQYIQPIDAPAIVSLFDFDIFGLTSIPFYTPLSNAPPHIPKRLHLLNCVFLI